MDIIKKITKEEFLELLKSQKDDFVIHLEIEMEEDADAKEGV